tara:strand:- start:324 stop:986 length:663 start_codon:yes stop_codon:yes gene_type:complete
MNFRKAIEPQRYKSLSKPVTKELTKVMATEIKGEIGDKLLDQVLELDDVSLPTKSIKKAKRKYLNKTAMMPKELVEGLYKECVVQCSNAMNSIFLVFFDKETGKSENFNSQKKKLDAVKGTHYIFMNELETIQHCLKPYTNSTMNIKHRSVRQICNEAYSRISNLTKDLQSAKRLDHWAVTEFAKEMTLFVTNFHVILHEQTPKKTRVRVLKEYCISEEL